MFVGHLPQKNLRIILDTQLKFDDHLKMVYVKISKTTGLLRKQQNVLLRAVLITIYNAFITPIWLRWYPLWSSV